jgi:hypothetical protein
MHNAMLENISNTPPQAQKNVELKVLKLEEPELPNKFLNRYDTRLHHLNSPEISRKVFEVYTKT